MKRILTPMIAVVCLAAAAFVWKLTQPPQGVGAVAQGPPDSAQVLFACQGRIEGGADPVDVSASMDGVIETSSPSTTWASRRHPTPQYPHVVATGDSGR